MPALLSFGGALFLAEWALLVPQPRVAAVLLYLHSAVLGGIAISAFWSLLNERFDPHSAKPLLARVAAAATFGGLVGGIGAERVAALLSQGALLGVLGGTGVACMVGAVFVARGAPPRRASTDAEVACPDPNCPSRFRITRTGTRRFSHAAVTAVPLSGEERS